MAEKSSKRKVVCPECEQADVELTRDDDGDDVGTCQTCGLDVGRVYSKRRYDKALAKLQAGEEEEGKKAKGKKKTGGFWG